MANKTRVGMIGVGNISPAYIKGCRMFDILDVAACADLDMARARQVAAEYDIPRALTVDELRELQFSQRKAEYVIGVGEKVASGELNLEEIAHESDEVIIKELTKIRGIGPWTAQSFLLFGLGRPNLFPMADIGIQNAIKKLFGMEQKPTREEMERLSAAWDPYLSYASLYLWRSIE